MESLKTVLVGSGMIPIPPTAYGAVEKHVWNLAKALRERGHTVEIINEVLGPRPWDEYRFALRARKIVPRLDCEILHLHTTGVASTFSLLGPRGYVYTSHSRHWTLRTGIRERVGFALEKRAVARARRVIALSDRMAHLMAGVAFADVVPNGVDTELYRPDYESRQGNRVVAVGRVERHKGLHLAAEALRGLDAHLTVVGPAPPGPYVEGLRRYPWVTLTGSVPEEVLVRYLATADVYVHPSYSEAMSLAVLEAMACGLPVVGTYACEGQVNHGENGLIVGGGSSDEAVVSLGEALSKLLTEDQFREAMARNSRKLAEERYRWPVVAAGVERVYHRALDQIDASSGV